MKAKRIAEIIANIAALKKLAEELKNELELSMGEQVFIACNIAMLSAELSAVICASVKKNSDQLRKKQAQEDKGYFVVRNTSAKSEVIR